MKKILVLATGGTIVSTAHKNGLAPGMTINQLSAFFDSAEGPIDFIPLMDKDSTNMQPEDWIKMSQTIRSHPDFDAYLITHGTDTMAYTAAGLSYLLSDFEKPVIITGSQIPLTFEHTDAKKNINDALLAARTIDFPGVYVVFDGRVIAGTRAVKVKSKSFDAFDSINFPLIAQIENQQFKILYRPSFNPGPITSRTGLNTNIYVIRAFPGLSVKFFDFIEQEKAALIIESLGNGGLPSVGRNLVAGVEKLSQAGLPVIITTQIMNEGQDIDLYEVGQRVEQAGGITAGDMNTEAIVAKLMWTMRQTKNLSQIKNIMQTPIAHDLDHL
ncbi:MULTISPECIES: asparaginase [Oenococcus]|uniref:asparaginase n=1 Tax=Oenococcus kitaharae DSM 17330 TaxID=1045004 RepID=G9WHV5_9LACO|nr:asparaginase [Oenococcus kitaharae]EHN58679.1 L-asparaginase [Oenococcus kitaharae DSM 17330]OEY83234.1 asparaginase [Oenococcus kitaharae]OEY84243.1 asparaginase [Oenococcus kitaharae]OEY85850.1 asparaginase [Oenococcus kitaharae]